jgi:hypothetical protein
LLGLVIVKPTSARVDLGKVIKPQVRKEKIYSFCCLIYVDEGHMKRYKYKKLVYTLEENKPSPWVAELSGIEI